jgi:hypothetical protein
MIVTPAKPMTTPVTLPGVMRSSWVSTLASSTANSGVVAFRIAARPLATWLCAHAISENGMTLLISPMTKNAPHVAASVGRRSPFALTTR